MRWAQGIKDEEDSASPWGVPGVTEETDTEQRTTVIEYEKCSSADAHGASQRLGAGARGAQREGWGVVRDGSQGSGSQALQAPTELKPPT